MGRKTGADVGCPLQQPECRLRVTSGMQDGRRMSALLFSSSSLHLIRFETNPKGGTLAPTLLH